MTEAMRERASARKVLTVLVGLLVTILALQGLASVKPGGFEAFAQTSPSPTPTGTSIQFLNPSKKTSLEISDKDDRSAGASKTAYHLVAWTHLAPAGAGVQFKYDPAGDTTPEITIGNGTQVAPDTWEFFWDLPDTIGEAGGPTGGPPPTVASTGNLRAILFNSTGSEVARDEEAVTINNKDRTASEQNDFRIEDQAETVEITYPTNGGGMGFFGSPDGTYTGVIDVSYSTGASSVTTATGFYTVDPPGTDPNFVACANGSENAGATLDDGLRCTLAAGNRPNQVTAVAVVVSDRTQEPVTDLQSADRDTSDGHRVFAYEQDPSSVVINPGSESEDANKCTNPVFVATVLDQNGRKVAGANVDVHAQGPTDNLFFDDSSGANSSPNQAPDQGGHAAEQTADCETAAQPTFTAAGTSGQGDHEQLTAPDVKHIESTVATSSARTGGTEDTGGFRFNLMSQDPGGTQITAWADEDFNDRFCSAEASGNATHGWASPPPSATGVASEESVCPRPTPGVTGTATPTATATATTTATATPTGSPTTTGPTQTRTLALSADDGQVLAGTTVNFSGQLLSGNDRSCSDNEFIQIQRRILGTTTFENLSSTTTDSQGRFSFGEEADRSADYVALAPAHDNCRSATSPEVQVLVQVRVAIAVNDRTPERGDRIRFKSSVRPQHDGTNLLLQRRKGGRWVTVDRDRLNRRSIAQFTVRANFNRASFRTRWKSQDSEHESNNSRRMTIRTRR
jgi:hypothetical protein